MSDKSINIHLIDGKGYIWNADGKNIILIFLYNIDCRIHYK